MMERECFAVRPQELKEAEWRRYRAECKVRCLEAALDRIDPQDFDSHMDLLELAQAELDAAARQCVRIRAGLSRME